MSMNTTLEDKRLNYETRKHLARAIKAIRAAERLRDQYMQAHLQTLAPKMRP